VFLSNFFNLFLKYKNNSEARKNFILGIAFLLILGCYTIFKELKDLIFVIIVGQEYLPEVKNISYLFMIPLIGIYSWLISKVEKHILFIIYCLFYGIGGLVSAYFILDPKIGIENQIASTSRLFGWIYYIFSEGHAPFLVSVLWAYFNSISKPSDVKKSYIIMTITSKFGGFLFAFLALIFNNYFAKNVFKLNEVWTCTAPLIFSSLITIFIGFIILYLEKTTPKSLLSGYADGEEKKIDKENKNKSEWFGLKPFLKYPYTLGIFGMFFFWEIVNVILNYMRIGVAVKEASGDIIHLASFLYKNAMMTHIVGFAIACIGTSAIVYYLGEKISLILIPILIGSSILICLYFGTTSAIVTAYILIRAINYAFAYPLREALYIPTTNEIRFKTKSWIDSFGTKFAKALGSVYNKVMLFIPNSILNQIQIGFFCSIIFMWTALAYFVGKRWQKAIDKKEIIGK
jgi:AAA family ATP:ADP antiporter